MIEMMKKYIYSILLAIAAVTTVTSCDSDANILQADETIGMYGGDVLIEWIALKDMEYKGEVYKRGETVEEYHYFQENKDTCFVFLNISNEGRADLMLAVPSDEAYESYSDYFMTIQGLPVSELGNRVATVGTTQLTFGSSKFNTKTVYQPYKNAEFDYIEDGVTKTDHVSGEAAFISGNYQMVLNVTIAEDAEGDLGNFGLSIAFNGWLIQGQDSNDLIKRRNKR